MMKEHTVIVGTSKSMNENAYYIKSKDKFWGLIFKSGLTNYQMKPEEFDAFTQRTGIGFTELVTNKIESKDSKLKGNLELVATGLNDFIEYLNSNKAPNRVVFNGKTAAGWFFQFLDKGKLDKRASSTMNKVFYDFQYGKLPRYYKNTELFVLPNTSAVARKYWDEKPWIEFWTMIKEEINK